MKKLYRYIRNLVDKKLSVAISALLVLVLGFVVYWSNSNAAAVLFATQGVDKAQAVAGDTLTYTLIVRNDGDADLHSVLVAEHFDSNITYVPGSTTLEWENNNISIDDNWLNTGTNLGTIKPGEVNYLKFRANIASAVADGTVIETTSQVKSDEFPDWIQRAAQTQIVPASQTTTFTGGDTFLGVNNTLQESTWHDPVTAEMGQVIQFKFRIVNEGNYDARNVQVRVQIPWDPQVLSNNLISRATVTADNASSMTDALNVYLNGPASYMWPRDGHYFLNGTTGLYNCPNGCAIPNQFLWEPMNIGTIVPGASVEILFKAEIRNLVSPTPSPSVSPTPTPSVSPTPAVLGTSVPTALPETGDDTGVLLVLAGIGFGIVGIYLFKRFRLV